EPSERWSAPCGRGRSIRESFAILLPGTEPRVEPLALLSTQLNLRPDQAHRRLGVLGIGKVPARDPEGGRERGRAAVSGGAVDQDRAGQIDELGDDPLELAGLDEAVVEHRVDAVARVDPDL